MTLPPALNDEGHLVDRCEDCRFYHPGEGTCHRHAPRPVMQFQCRGWTEEEKDRGPIPNEVEWPYVDEDNHCGEFEPWPGGDEHEHLRHPKVQEEVNLRAPIHARWILLQRMKLSSAMHRALRGAMESGRVPLHLRGQWTIPGTVSALQRRGYVDERGYITDSGRKAFLDFEDALARAVETAPPATPRRPQEDKETLLLKKVDELELSLRSITCLKDGHIVYIGELVQKTPDDLLGSPNFGRKSLNEIKEVLRQMGLCLGMKLPGWAPPTEATCIIEPGKK